jgi:site-specific DNA recombinase
MNSTKTKTVIYCRVSSKEQEDTGYSLDAQEKLLKEYAVKNHLATVKKYRISESANGKQIRKTFDEMMQYVTRKNISVILCEKIDRLTRNMKDAAVISDWIQADEKREVHFVKESFVVSKNTKAHENLVWDMKVAIARFYTNNLSEEVRNGHKEKLAQGWLPAKPPLGYKTIGEKGRKIHVVDEIAAPYIRKMFEWYAADNYSLARVESGLHKEGLRTEKGKKVCLSRIHRLLSNPFYYGKIPWRGELHIGKHEPLISKDLFDKVQQNLKRKTNNPQFTKHNPLFKARILCEHCGGLVTWELQKGHWYGHCNNHSNSKHCPKKTYIRQEKVEEQVFSIFERVAPKNDWVMNEIERILKEEQVKKTIERQQEVGRISI